MINSKIRRKKTRLFLFLAGIIALASSCNYRKFEKLKWNEKNDMGVYINRNSMLRDLMYHQHLKGKTYNGVISLLGPPEKDTEQSPGTLNYTILKEYNNTGEPVHVKTLTLRISVDSIVSKMAVREMKKD